jgi:ATPase subunit of ABC transporter with duplicated ATPase domains
LPAWAEVLAPRRLVLYTRPVLTIKKLTKTLGGRTLLREAEMSINWGERVALVGPN